DVNLAQAARSSSATGATPAASQPSAALRLTAVSLHPRTFRASRGTTVRFTLSAPARVRLAAGRVRRAVGGHAGRNAVRLKPHLRPGRYRLRLTAGAAVATA